MKAFNDQIGEWASKSQGVGSWIQANFEAIFNVTKFQYKQRVCECEWNKGIRLTFSDGSYQDFELQNEASLQTFILRKPVVTRYVEVKVLSEYSRVNNGARDIIFWGCITQHLPSTKKETTTVTTGGNVNPIGHS